MLIQSNRTTGPVRTPSKASTPRGGSSSTVGVEPRYIEPQAPRPTPLANGFTASMRLCDQGRATVTVATPGGNSAFSAEADRHTVNVAPDGQLVFAQGDLVCRWDPESGELSNFKYSVDPYGTTKLRALVGLEDGRTLALGEASMFRSPHISIHGPDGKIEFQDTLGDAGHEVSLSQAFVSEDRTALYLGGHGKPKFGEGVGHGVYRTRLTPGQAKLETLVFRKTEAVNDGRVLVTDRGEIVTSEGNELVRRSQSGKAKARYSNFGALRRDLGAFTRSLPSVPLGPNASSSSDLNDHFRELKAGNWNSSGAPLADGTYRFSAHRVKADSDTPLFQTAGLPTVPFSPARTAGLGGAVGLLAGAAAGALTSGNLVGAAIGGLLGGSAGGTAGYAYEKILHSDLSAQRQVEAQALKEDRPEVALGLRGELGLDQVNPQQYSLATVYQTESTALVDFPESGMFVAFADGLMTVFDPRGKRLRETEQTAQFTPGRLQLGETEYDLNRGTVHSGEWLEIERGMVKRAAVPAGEGTEGGQGQRLVSYRGNGLFEASDRAARSVPLEPEALGYPISLAPVAQSDGLVEHTERLLEGTPAFRSVDRTDRYRYGKIDPYHWTEAVDRELVASEVEAVLSDGTKLKGHGSALFIEDRKVDGGRLEADRNGVQLSRFLKGEVVQTQQSRGALSALTGGKLVSTRTDKSVDYVNRVVQSVRPDGEMVVQRWALPQNIASARVDMVRADRHLITPDGILTSTGAYDTSLSDDGQILIGTIDHFTQRVQVPEDLQNLELLVRPESVGHQRPQA